MSWTASGLGLIDTALLARAVAPYLLHPRFEPSHHKKLMLRRIVTLQYSLSIMAIRHVAQH